jgi:hypothetical protein
VWGGGGWDSKKKETNAKFRSHGVRDAGKLGLRWAEKLFRRKEKEVNQISKDLYWNIKRTIETDAFFLQYSHFWERNWGLNFGISKSGNQLLPFGFVSLCNSTRLRFEV